MRLQRATDGDAAVEQTSVECVLRRAARELAHADRDRGERRLLERAPHERRTIRLADLVEEPLGERLLLLAEDEEAHGKGTNPDDRGDTDERDRGLRRLADLHDPVPALV